MQISKYIGQHRETFIKVIDIVKLDNTVKKVDGRRSRFSNAFMNKIGVQLPVSSADSILAVNLIDNQTLDNLKDAYYNKQLDAVQVASIEKRLIVDLFGFKALDKQWLYDNIRKINAIYNFRLLTGKLIVSDKDKKYLEKRIAATEMVKQVLVQQGFADIEKNLDEKTLIKQKIFDANTELVKTKCDMFTDPIQAKKLVGIDKVSATSRKDYLGTINGILKKWNIKISLNKKSRKIVINGKQIEKPIMHYTISCLS